ncbi:MAG: dienelactone hydrolase family protein [Planctomycetota bacterium]|nr:dienelactone hydrolase family protein [Planctomycetota bacterium]
MSNSENTRRQFLTSCLVAASSGSVARLAMGQDTCDVPWLDEVQTRPDVVPPGAPKLSPLLTDAQGRKISDLAAWRKNRDEIKNRWLDFLGPLARKRIAPPRLEVVEEDRTQGVIRRRVRYQIEPGVMTEAYLLMPERLSAKAPGVAVFHTTTKPSILQPAGVKGLPEKAFGLKLARRGYVTFCPRNYLWPDNLHEDTKKTVEEHRRRHPQSTGMAKMLYDARVAVDILAALPQVDATRLGAVGHSLGAKEVLYLAAFDERIKATVSSEGGIGSSFSNWDAPWYLGRKIGDKSFPHEHHELLSLIAPRAFLLIGGDSADGDRGWPFIEAALKVYRLYGKRSLLGLFNHKQGHSVPPSAERHLYEWIDVYC